VGLKFLLIPLEGILRIRLAEPDWKMNINPETGKAALRCSLWLVSEPQALGGGTRVTGAAGLTRCFTELVDGRQEDFGAF